MKFAVALFLLSVCVIPICGWTIVWQDEFDGNKLDEKKWQYQQGDGCQYGICGWGNNEQQWYKRENVRVANGILTIEAKREDSNGKKYTSARIDTKNKGDWQFGKVEVRAKLPKGQGAWPAIWMLPTDNKLGEWPRSGEIDIMEYRGQTPNEMEMTAHFGDSRDKKSQRGTKFTLPKGSFADEFHNFGIEWGQDYINWTVDGAIKHTVKKQDTNPFNYPFNNRFHLILNLAVGGNFVGNVGADNIFPMSMQVDWVRVFRP